jgi:hypothetical protein
MKKIQKSIPKKIKKKARDLAKNNPQQSKISGTSFVGPRRQRKSKEREQDNRERQTRE